jgi:hypothetical protein
MAPEEAVTLPPDPLAVIVYVTVPLVIVGVTDTVPLQLTDPDQLPSVEDPVHVVAFVVATASVKLVPCGTVVVEGVSVAVGAGVFTVTVALAVVVPPAFVEVMVYVDVAVGDTVMLPVRLVLVVRPGPETDALVALLPAFHAITVPCPSVMMPGVAVIVGAGGAATVTVAEAVAVPPAPLQVRVYVLVAVGFFVTVPLVADNASVQLPDATADVLLVQE